MSRSGVICVFFALVLGLPLLGVLWAGEPLGRCLEFLPRTNCVQHEPFFWPGFLALTLLTALVVGSILLPIARANLRLSSLLTQHSSLTTQHDGFPMWGWLGIGRTGLW